tara:strand:+ start:903 stop:2123 length:1221 start_codon:yes stop_codon:yes gene_type:complete
MSIPLVSNVGFTEVTQSLVDSNSGVLNTIAGSKINLPIQYFKLSENISGNLTLNNVANNKKIILDTNAKTLLNSSGSPLTNNSSTAMELKGSGNIQSQLKTSTKTIDTTSHTGTTVFDNTNGSNIAVVSASTSNNTENFGFTNYNNNYNPFQLRSPSGKTITISGTDITSNSILTPAQARTVMGSDLSNVSNIYANNNPYGGYQNNTGSYDLYATTGNFAFSSAFSGYRRMVAITLNSSYLGDNTSFAYLSFNTSTGQIFNSFAYRQNNQQDEAPVTQWTQTSLNSPQGNPIISYITVTGVTVTGTGRTFTFTNLMTQASTGGNAATYTLSGADPFDNVTVGHSGGGSNTSVANRSSTDGSFNITLTVSGSDANSKPYVLVDVNNGTGSIDTSTQGYTGILSTKVY